MASACVNNIGVSPESFPPPHSSFRWLSPRISLSRDESKISKPSPSSSSAANPSEKKPDLDSPSPGAGDFEFLLDDPAVMLPADELFSDGKLMPLQLRPVPSTAAVEEVRSPETAKACRRSDGDLSFANDPYLFSPKAPRCSSRWRELLGLKRLYHSNSSNKQDNSHSKTTSSLSSSTSPASTSSSSSNSKSIRLFLYRNSKTSSLSSSSTSDPSLSVPLLNNSSDCDSVSTTSNRLSLSSYDDVPRHSLDSQTPNPNPSRLRTGRPSGSSRVGRSPVRCSRPDPSRMASRGVSVDSPRMNSSGRVLFQSLERSSSSPSSFNGGRPRYSNYRGMERSYSANVVRVTPVLNVPVCSLRGSSKSGVFGFGQLFSSSSSQSQKKETGGNNNNNNGGSSSRNHVHHHQQQPINSNSISMRSKKEVS